MKLHLDQAWREALAVAALLFVLSYLTAQAGIFFGERFVSPGAGLDQARAVTSADLFRFDSLHYNDVAERGYSYNGDPYSSPNIVFAPLFPVMTAGVALLTGLDTVISGFLVNKIAFYFALVFAYMFLVLHFGKRVSACVLAALVTSAGSYSLNAYYSESLMFLALAVVLYAYERKWWLTLALASAALGAARVTAIPVSVLACLVLAQDWRRSPLAVLALSGVVAYLLFIASHFGNPFALFPEIQSASWGLFHPPTSLVGLLTGEYLLKYWGDAFARGFADPMDIKTLNLVWTTLAAASVVYTLWRWRFKFWVLAFTGYFIFIYVLNSSSDYLISAHRFFMPMIPIYLMSAAAVTWVGKSGGSKLAWSLGGMLLIANLFYGVAMTGYFNMGVWYYF